MPMVSLRAHSFRTVQSRQNARVKELRSGFAHAALTEHGFFSIEGEHLVQEAIASHLTIAAVFVRIGSESLLDRLDLPESVEILGLAEDVFASAVRTETSQGIAALVEPHEFSLEDVLAGSADGPLVVSAGLQDPGNLGT